MHDGVNDHCRRPELLIHQLVRDAGETGRAKTCSLDESTERWLALVTSCDIIRVQVSLLPRQAGQPGGVF